VSITNSRDYNQEEKITGRGCPLIDFNTFAQAPIITRSLELPHQYKIETPNQETDAVALDTLKAKINQRSAKEGGTH
jgi:hypothetical protein